jgi:hypothetical protein
LAIRRRKRGRRRAPRLKLGKYSPFFFTINHDSALSSQFFFTHTFLSLLRFSLHPLQLLGSYMHVVHRLAIAF